MKIFKYQLWHVLILAALTFFLYSFAKKDVNFLQGELYGISTLSWCILTFLAAVIHQIYVLIFWRAELHYQSLTKWFGERGFKLFKVGFAVLILSRPVTITCLAIANAQTISINTTFAYVLAALLFAPAVYLFYSLRTYFGIDRAFGIDHFYPEKFKNEKMVKKGIFKYTSNAMYVFGFFALWIPGILFQSKAAIFLALFSHIYIWVHYYTTELPDMKIIYGNEEE